MKTAILACNTIRDELLLAVERTGVEFDTFWVESNLHNFPDKLRDVLQGHLDELAAAGYERVLMALAFCGGSVTGLRTGSFELVVPRTDDCISLMLGGIAERERLSEGKHSIYLTKGWLEHESNIWSEYEYTLEKFGEKTAQSVIEMMYGNYDRLSLVETGAYDPADISELTGRIAERFGLELNAIPGTTTFIELLLTGPFDEDRFIVVAPNSELQVDPQTLV